MTTPIDPNGMLYPTTPIILCAGSVENAAEAARQYGIDIEASADYLTVVTTVADVSVLVMDGRAWSLTDETPEPVRRIMKLRFGLPIRQDQLFAVVNANSGKNKAWLAKVNG